MKNRMKPKPMKMNYVVVTLTLEPNGYEFNADYFRKMLMAPAHAPGEDLIPSCNIPCIGDFVRRSTDDYAIADVAGVKVESGKEFTAFADS